MVHSEIVEGHCGMRRVRSEIEKVVHFGMGVEDRDRLAG